MVLMRPNQPEIAVQYLPVCSVHLIFMEKGVRRANQANNVQLFQAGQPSSVLCMCGCSVRA